MAMALIAGLLGGMHAAISALLGGMISVVAGWVFAVVGDGRSTRSAGAALLGMLRAQAVKVGVMVLLLWLVLTLYRDVVVPGLIGSFVATVLIFALAVIVRES